ncbi:PPOX class F420-dependent oxidoreductase [Bailinhaonella thermotolerans]|uniref:PPOX class F420-dependent oxidoreductase n=1 Tax=Bailinhaonella thermotolerans TaxID=1070861 RepID=A0A3A4AY63_9ACTN|nr:PPOX class F420-dependent oxidoreductase [Bailinhaonella thermotolerans]RJL30817.1 PPOX class F420-dependent oxidoreductase [Bailinhaonella thermotolerans]
MAQLGDNARKLFDAKNFATVTTLQPDGTPHSSVVWVKTEDDEVHFSTTKDRRKYQNLQYDPRATVLVFDPADPYHYAEVRGEVTVEDDPQSVLINELSRKYTGADYTNDPPGAQRVIIRITPRKVVVRGD